MNEWKKVKISDIGKVITGKTPKTSNSEYYGGNIPFLTPSDDMSVKYSRRTNKYITELGRLSVKNATLPPNAICVSCIGSDLGKVVITTQETVTNQQINSIVVDTDKFDIDFVYYSMLELGKILNFHSKTSTAVPIVNKSNFSQYEINCPGLDVQKKIGFVLSSIDKKIEKNEKINNNLEQQAQAYFNELFVVNADPNWSECTLSDIGSVVAGGTPSKSKPEYYADQGIAWITPKDLSVNKSKFISHGENDISELGFSKSSVAKLPAGTILFSSRAPIGYIAIAQNEVTTNQGFKSVIPNENISTAYMYFLLKNLLPTIEGMASGSTFKEISGAAMKSVPTVMPDADTIQLFSSFCEPVFKEQEILEAENQRLSALRDSLLPKLMSSELDVSNIEL